MAIFNLRPYQVETKDEIRRLFSLGKKRVIMCKPTGSGKTVTFADMAREAVKNGYIVMVVVDRSELLKQAESKLISYGLSPTLITSGRSGRRKSSTYIATVQTLVRRQPPEGVGMIIIDEAHKQIFDKVVRAYPEILIIGATATPIRSGKMTQLADVYEELVEKVTIKDLIAQGFLSPAITYGAKVDTSNVKIKGGDYDNDDLYKAFDKATLYAGVVDKYRKFADGTKAVVFCVNVKHSKKVVESFKAAGISAVHLDGKTPKPERARILEAYKRGQYRVLSNVDVLTAGFDEWTIETIIVNLATKSLPKWLQMCGRGSRITPHELQGARGHLQKEHFNIIDMGGNVYALGFWEQEREFNLKHKRKDELSVAPVKECPEDKVDENQKNGCGAIMYAGAPKCKICGYIFPKVIKEEKHAEFIQLENNEFLPAELVNKKWGAMSIDELEKVREIKGYKMGWIVKQILYSKDLELIDYARFKKYKAGAAWVERMEKMYIRN